jgi:hypothetical protein
MAAYGYIVRKFIRYGEIIPEHFVGLASQAAVVGTTLTLNTADCSGVVTASIAIPDNLNVAATTFNITAPYKLKLLPSTHFVATTGTAANLTVAVGKAAPSAGATAVMTSTAAITGANVIVRMSTHVSAAETVNPTLADTERITVTITKATAAQVADGVLHLQFVRAD